MVAESNSSVTLKVEGRIVSDSASLLEAECLRHLVRGYKVVLDFGGVTFIDARGAAVLKELKAENLELINCWPLIEEQIIG
jgi:anti-anti-sigma regulatory factor